MSKEMKSAVILSASPKVNEESVSKLLAALAEKQFASSNLQVTRLDVRESMKKQCHQAFEIMNQVDALVIIFPLYYFCMPGILTRFLQDYRTFYEENQQNSIPKRIYTVVNCGFPEPGINEEAVRVIESFSRSIHASFRFGVMIGGGGMVMGAKNAPFMKKTFEKINAAFSAMAGEITGDKNTVPGNISVPICIPRKLYLFMGSKGWMPEAKKNGLTKKDLYRTPYRSE